MQITKTIVVFLVIGIMVSVGCSNSHHDTDVAPNTPTDQGEETSVSTEQLLAGQGFQVISSVTSPDGATGYLAQNADGKRCVVLRGSPYSLGYEMGYLLPKGTQTMARTYTAKLIEEYVGVTEGSALYNMLYGMALTLAEKALYEEQAIPEEYVREMQGMVDGANAAAGQEIVTFNDVLLLNEGLDTLYAMLFTGKFPKVETASTELLGCNGFVVSGAATGGKVYHGRDFMLATGGVYQDEALMAVYVPEKDHGYPFVTLTAPGFVGLTTGLNSQGLSMGVDVVFGGATRSTPGIGCLFVLRDIVQHCRNLDDAIATMRSLNRGVAWIYVLADDEFSSVYTHGVVVEEGMRQDENGRTFDGPEDLPLWQQIAFQAFIQQLPAQDYSAGVVTRTQDWAYPEAFAGLDDFPLQREDRADLVLATNNYIHPLMVLTTHTPWIQLIQGAYWKTSQTLERYQDLNDRIIEACESGPIDFAKARSLIDFMNPNNTDGKVWDRYTVDGPVEGHHDLFDNQARIMECLYGYYHKDEPWVRIDLKPFTELQE